MVLQVFHECCEPWDIGLSFFGRSVPVAATEIILQGSMHDKCTVYFPNFNIFFGTMKR